MHLYTFILEFDGGTYLSQVKAKDFRGAPMVWLREKVPRDIESSIAKQMDGEKPTEVAGLIHTWCLTFTVKDKLALVHYVETAK